MQRFNGSQAEATFSNVDTSAFKWNVEELIAQKAPESKRGEVFSMLAGDGPIRPERQLHYNVPASVKQKAIGTHPLLDASAARTKASPLVNPLRGEAAANKGRGRVPVTAKFQSIPLTGSISPKAFAAAPHKGAANHSYVSPKSFCQMRPAAKSEAAPRGDAATTSKMLGKDNFWSEFHAQCVAGKETGCDLNFDGSQEITCSYCRLPMGDFGYPAPGGRKGAMIHGECMARQALEELVNDDERRRREDEQIKALRREEYGIGWKVQQIPRNFDLQQRLKEAIVSYGMCCLVLQEGSKSVRLAPTIEPSAAINLEYLALALQVRRKEGREPLFSLDPVHREDADDTHGKESSQVKRFEPEWLAGTSVGEVLFQADYHLKELSMGECEQPVVGMKSVSDLIKDEEDHQTWNGREWFMVRHAEVQMSEDHVLVPQVKMGVEAREQVNLSGSLEDAPITRKDHPLVKYAESFSKNFDLIAERKSVVYHLRELAKATVVAKFLTEADIAVEESWLSLAGEVEEACALEIPQLWNERAHAKIRVKDGEVVGAEKGINPTVYGIYGGVSFGLDKFDISRIAPRRAVAVGGPGARLPGAPPGPPSGAMAFSPGAGVRPLAGLISPMTSVTPLKPAAVQAVPLSASLSGLSVMPRGMGMAPPIQAVPLSAALSGVSVPSFQAALSMQTTDQLPRGVDLNLNQFSLETSQDSAGHCISEPQSKDACEEMTSSFWNCVDQGECSEDWKLLQSIYNPNLSDRRMEGENFMPPDTSSAYTNKLCSLIKEEEDVRQQRKDHFCSINFSENFPGEFFPTSWTSKHAIARSRTAKQGGTLQPRRDCAAKTEQVIKSGPPVFQKTTEDGMVWRIYRVGSLEVRTTQEHAEKEIVGAVFSVREKTRAKTGQTALGHERIIKATEYVEKSSQVSEEDAERLECRYYVVLETEYGSTIVAEHLRELVAWEENVTDLEDRNSLAKVVRTASCRRGGVTVKDLKAILPEKLEPCFDSDARSRSRSFATGLFVAAVGGISEAIQARERHRSEIEKKDLADGDASCIATVPVASS